MGRVLCCWELGAGYGHLYRLLPIAEALTQAGYQVTLVTRSIERARSTFTQLEIEIFPAPSWLTPAKSFPLSLNYPQNLLRNGYWHALSLQQRLIDWLSLFDTHQPDLILAEHAPTALLAARIREIPRCVTGTGFTLPPRVTPIPGIQPWFPLPEHQLTQIENNFLAIVNPLIKTLGGEELASVSGIFDQAEPFLCTLPELDHYPMRDKAEYLGPILFTPNQQDTTWPENDGMRIFLYMNSANRFLRPVLSILKELPVSALAFISALPEDEIQIWETDNLRIVLQPVNLSQVVNECQLVISQGGTNTGTFMLLNGIPLFILPLELEQMLWAYRLSQQGLAASVNYFSKQPDILSKLQSILESDALAQQAKNFSQRYANYAQEQTIQHIVEKCSALSDT